MSSRAGPAVAQRVFDTEAALVSTEGDRELLGELVGLFLEEWEAQLDEVRQAAAALQPAAMRDVAHSLKGAVGTLGAHEAFDAALRLETLARAGDLASVQQALAALEAALGALVPQLQAWLASEGGSAPA